MRTLLTSLPGLNGRALRYLLGGAIVLCGSLLLFIQVAVLIDQTVQPQLLRALSLIHISSPRDMRRSRMPSSA